VKNLRTALIVQWICFSVPVIGLIVASTVALNNPRLTDLLSSAAFLVAIGWIGFVAIYGRKLSWRYKFPVVLLVVTFLFALLGPRTMCSGCGNARNAAAKAQISALSTALDSYKQDVGSYPSTEEGLQAFRVKPDGVVGWDGPYLQKDVPLDPWGHPYIYKFPGKIHSKPEIVSYGADGAPGGKDENADIVSE
jgi:general secretion pathway protein G